MVHDYLYTIGGAERVLAAIFQSFPDADLFCLFNVLSEADRKSLGYRSCTTSFLQRMPFVATRHRLYLPLMPIAIEQMDLRGYDLVLSSSYAAAKGVVTGPDQLHVAYVHSPMRYAWDMQHEYLEKSRSCRGLGGILTRALLHYMRIWDTRTASGVDAYLANSRFIARRIRKTYGRRATVLYPPVDVPDAPPRVERQDHFLAASRLVPYKNIHLIAEAFRDLPEQRLIIAGDGPERERIAALQLPNVTMVGHVSDQEMRRLMATARAFIFAAEEDFGIIPVEAQGQGTPVIALGKGGVRETVVTTGANPTGLFFRSLEAGAIRDAVLAFVASESCFTAAACHDNAQRFSRQRFCEELVGFVADRFARFATETGIEVGHGSGRTRLSRHQRRGRLTCSINRLWLRCRPPGAAVPVAYCMSSGSTGSCSSRCSSSSMPA